MTNAAATTITRITRIAPVNASPWPTPRRSNLPTSGHATRARNRPNRTGTTRLATSRRASSPTRTRTMAASAPNGPPATAASDERRSGAGSPTGTPGCIGDPRVSARSRVSIIGARAGPNARPRLAHLSRTCVRAYDRCRKARSPGRAFGGSAYMQLVIALLAVLLGVLFAFGGWRFFLILLPFWGLFMGFNIGTEATRALLGDGTFATLTSWAI